MVQRKPRKKSRRKSRSVRRRGSLLSRLFSRTSTTSYKSKKRRSSKSKHPRVRQRILRKLQKTVILLLIVGLMGGLIFVGVKSVLDLKTGNNNDEDLITLESTGDVVGLPGLPAYPGSAFLFEEQITEDSVQQFLSDGQSAYSLPESATWDDVVTFYNNELPSRGWEHVQSVPLGDELRLHGEYWVFRSDGSSDVSDEAGEPENENENAETVIPNENTDGSTTDGQDANALVIPATEETALNNQTNIQIDNQPANDQSDNQTDNEPEVFIEFGLRIYSKINAVWYEKITVAQAESGLADEVAKEKEIELLLAMGSMQELPENFPWELSFPEIWDAEVRESRLIEAPLVEFYAIESEGVVTIEPIAFDTGKDLTVIAQEFIEEVNSRRSDEDKFTISSTGEVSIADQDAITLKLAGGETDGWLAAVSHPENGIIYAITSFGGEEAFFNYILENISVKI